MPATSDKKALPSPPPDQLGSATILLVDSKVAVRFEIPVTGAHGYHILRPDGSGHVIDADGGHVTAQLVRAVRDFVFGRSTSSKYS